MGFFDFLFGKNKDKDKQCQSVEQNIKEETTLSRKIGNAYLLLFSATWCGPSKRFIKEIESGGISNFSLIDVDKNDDLVEKYGIRNVPTTILTTEDGKIINKWIGYDDEDPGQSQFIKYVKQCGYNILIHPSSEQTNISHKGQSDSSISNARPSSESEIHKVLEKIIGTKENPVQVDHQKLNDGSIYTGEAVLLRDGTYMPQGYGKKYVSKELEMSGFFEDGNINGVCYLNMHFAMVLGHFKEGRVDGWAMSIENGYQFGVMKDDDFTNCISNHMTWIVELTKGMSGSPIHIFSKKQQILYGLNMKQIQAELRFYTGPTGMFFMNSGDVYLGTDDVNLSKTGIFVKYCNDGYIQIGRFDNGTLVQSMDIQDVLDIYLGSSEKRIGILGVPMEPKQSRLDLLDFRIDTRINYFSENESSIDLVDDVTLMSDEEQHLDQFRQAVAYMDPSVYRKETITVKKFIFTTNQHQRYENGIPVGATQECVRTITVGLNTEGCDGYLLTPGDGFIIQIFNDDIGRPQMADKPMRVFRKNNSTVELRGYEVLARSPFGYQEIDLGDYGFVIFYEKGVISRCQMHMLDRDTYIEYKISSTKVVI